MTDKATPRYDVILRDGRKTQATAAQICSVSPLNSPLNLPPPVPIRDAAFDAMRQALEAAYEEIGGEDAKRYGHESLAAQIRAALTLAKGEA